MAIIKDISVGSILQPDQILDFILLFSFSIYASFRNVFRRGFMKRMLTVWSIARSVVLNGCSQGYCKLLLKEVNVSLSSKKKLN